MAFRLATLHAPQASHGMHATFTGYASNDSKVIGLLRPRLLRLHQAQESVVAETAIVVHVAYSAAVRLYMATTSTGY